MAIVCIDSMIVVWAVKGKATSGQEHMIPIAKSLIKELDKNKKTIILPSPVITEILAPVSDDEDRNKIIMDFNLYFRLAAFDPKSAAISARIWNERMKDWKDIYKDGDDTLRNRFKYDLLILGCAIANNAECLYTGDKKLTKLAQHYIDVENVFDSPQRITAVQTALF